MNSKPLSPREPGQVSREMNKMQEVLDLLEEQITVLANDMNEALRQDSPAGPGGSSGPVEAESPMAPLAVAIRAQRRQAEAIKDGVEDMIGRLEL